MSDCKSFSTVILCAGESSRMGQPKAFLPFYKSKTFIEQLIEVYLSAGAKQISVVCNRQLYSSVIDIISRMAEPHLISAVINAGISDSRFSSIKSGIENILQKGNLFVQNIDNPFTEPQTVHALSQSLLPNAYAVPVINGRSAHPILLAPEIVQAVVHSDHADTNLREFLSRFRRIEVPVTTIPLIANINTPADYGKWFGQVV